MTIVEAASTDLFRHIAADKAAFYRAIMDVFAAAKRQYRLQLRPDEVLSEAAWRERWKGLRGWFLSTGNEPPKLNYCGRGRERRSHNS